MQIIRAESGSLPGSGQDNLPPRRPHTWALDTQQVPQPLWSLFQVLLWSPPSPLEFTPKSGSFILVNKQTQWWQLLSWRTLEPQQCAWKHSKPAPPTATGGPGALKAGLLGNHVLTHRTAASEWPLLHHR